MYAIPQHEPILDDLDGKYGKQKLLLSKVEFCFLINIIIFKLNFHPSLVSNRMKSGSNSRTGSFMFNSLLSTLYNHNRLLFLKTVEVSTKNVVNFSL